MVRAAWNITTDYKTKFFGTYGREDILVPSRNIKSLVNRLNGYNLPCLLILRLYFDLGDNFDKLIAVERTGGCGEFARATARILYDTTGLPTRVIMMEGIDHTFPEVYIDGKWLVFDIIYTTTSRPVLASEYAHYLSKGEKRLDKYIARLMVETEKKEKLLDATKEHGFNVSTLVIKAIIDPTSSSGDEEPAANAKVEIFSVLNSYDPLVAREYTNDSSMFNVTLNGGKDYIVMIRSKEEAFVGVKSIYIPPNEHVEVEVRLHAYK